MSSGGTSPCGDEGEEFKESQSSRAVSEGGATGSERRKTEAPPTVLGERGMKKHEGHWEARQSAQWRPIAQMGQSFSGRFQFSRFFCTTKNASLEDRTSTGIPPNAQNNVPFSQRGWPAMETFVSGFKHPRLLHLLPTAPDSDAPYPDINLQPVRVPAAPSVFESELASKKFTNGADETVVRQLYAHFVSRTAPHIRTISFVGRQQFGDREARTLHGLLLHMENSGRTVAVESVDLTGTSVTDESVSLLLKALQQTAPGLKRLVLFSLPLGMQTLETLREGMDRGYFAVLNWLDLHDGTQVDSSCLDTVCHILNASQKRKVKRFSLDLQGCPVIARPARPPDP
uniref:Uncharacterized protein n=1 Tax=Chromera velia CCMP2878 TaxID=1169474 RepID=A0A0G4FQF0_9ALVE|eukprot:Cvel_18050.t1-p1 / transcript=Cvel_18050.t1 / gene=Cvel_18050 / organism=Chromera_velia_CCMP2878 / gene_product=hypothetical protein / transcript_product=hypothetical protein / location=Cvel_scaffold1474:26539-28118(+) / protein_length=342 / sequence_SO=supercontig / SO=protein_coding / is_pseudo=false